MLRIDAEHAVLSDAERGPQAVRYADFGNDWRFGGRHISGATAPGYPDQDFEIVTLPHCVAELSWQDWDPASWDGSWIYRRHVRLPPEMRGMRVFCQFEGVLTSATTVINDTVLGTHRGGYLPFGYEITDLVGTDDDVIAVVVDGSWQWVPPDGAPQGPKAVDYCQPAGIYREAHLLALPAIFVSDVFARPVDVLRPERRIDLEVTVDAGLVPAHSAELTVELRDGDRALAATTIAVPIESSGASTVTGVLESLGEVDLWRLDRPKLYDVVTRLTVDGVDLHEHRTRIGFREVRWETDGCYLNGERLQILGLNRHQIYPYVGHAMPARVQRRDAEILKHEFNCQLVRCAHYPQSRHFLDACDELGLLVWQEPPGWQFLPDDPDWLELARRDVAEMVIRDRNRPSIALWAARLNETANLPHFYRRTKELINGLDGSRPTTGAMRIYSTEDWLQDVFGYDDYSGDGVNAFLRPPFDVPYLISEAVGALSSQPFYRRTDKPGVLAQQAIAHAEVHDAARADRRYAGVLGWVAFDYGSQNGRIHRNVKTPGVADLFRVPKFGAAFYRSQVSPEVRPVIEPAFLWGAGEPGLPPQGPGQRAVILSNCDRLEVSVGGEHVITALPDRQGFPQLPYPPFSLYLSCDPRTLPELLIEGYVGSERVATRPMAADPSGDLLELVADDAELVADGSDMTRLTVRAVDAYGNWRRSGGEVDFVVTGDATLVGDNPFDFDHSPGVGAVWLRAGLRPGPVTVTATHARLGEAVAEMVICRRS